MSALLTIGAAWPDGRLEQREAARIANELMCVKGTRARALHHLYANTGVQNRRTIVTDESGNPVFFVPGSNDHPDGPSTDRRLEAYARYAPVLALQACAEALDASGTSADSITHLVTVSCTGMASPGVDHSLITSLRLPANTQRTNIGFMGCHGAINGLRVAHALTNASQSNKVLMCCVELCSLHFQYQPTNGGATANALFGDGSAACVLSQAIGGYRLRGFSSMLFPETSADMSWVVGDHGFRMSLAPSVPEKLRSSVRSWIEPWLLDHGLDIPDISHWAVHPGGPRIVESVIEGLYLEPEVAKQAVGLSMGVLRTYGNMSSPTVMMLLRTLFERGVDGPLVAVAFGPGLAGEACLIMPEE